MCKLTEGAHTPFIQVINKETKQSQSCLTNLAFYDGVAASVNKGRAIEVIYLVYCKSFDMVPDHILISKMERYGFEGWTIQWIKNWPPTESPPEACGQWFCVQTVASDERCPPWVLLGSSALFNIFINDKIDGGIKCTLNKFTYGTQLSGAVGITEGLPSKGTWTSSFKRAHINLTRFNNTKYKVLHLGWGNPRCVYSPQQYWGERLGCSGEKNTWHEPAALAYSPKGVTVSLAGSKEVWLPVWGIWLLPPTLPSSVFTCTVSRSKASSIR